ncbi:MAG: M15 family metallopeptidase [Terrimicrobiaceae bacterium]|jgi:peptidoglycan L-alanyl-D-glutamate endopeptidase CwlK|nr:M15 family metallopeptidase [Terrimicrobiaceae bacterium]
MIFDERTEYNIATLHPKVQMKARDFMELAVQQMERDGAVVKIISGNRSYSEQDALYAQGRTKPGRIVTNARGGYSNHNFGTAWDVGIFKNGKYLDDSPLYQKLGVIGQSLGLEWGGAWKSIQDEPHFEMKTGLTMAEKRSRLASGKDIFE